MAHRYGTYRDYSLCGASSEAAQENGLASPIWYQTKLPRAELKTLLTRQDKTAIKDTALLFGLMGLCLGGGIYFWQSLWSIPFWLIYGVFYGSAMDSRWHECGHGTAFRSRRYNRWLYHIASFCMIRNPVTWRWSHARHHTDTIIVGRDPEIQAMRPPKLFTLFLNFFGVFDAINGWKTMVDNAFGMIAADDLSYVPEAERPHLIRVARIWLMIYLTTIGMAIAMGSLLPLMIIGLPRLYGAWHHMMTGLLQHAGLADNVKDHRLNSRTLLLNPFSRFIYWNMNYHVEHHMFPLVPYHQLPKLHALIKHDVPEPTKSLWQGYREIIPILMKQTKEPDFYLRRPLPDTAAPYLQ